ncbi:MAG: YbaK/EbsC family protein [Clostridiales bacterium]|nr:YbaK/EbsC family protein [Clostridiales bacterium]
MSYKDVAKYFENAGLKDRVKVFEESSATVEMAAEAVGCMPKQIAKTLAFLIDDMPILIVAAGNVMIDNQKYREVFGQKSSMIPRDLVKKYIGHGLGGVCPFAVNDSVKTYLDKSLKQNEVVYVAAGSPNSVVKLSISELEQHSHFKDWIDVCSI